MGLGRAEGTGPDALPRTPRSAVEANSAYAQKQSDVRKLQETLEVTISLSRHR